AGGGGGAPDPGIAQGVPESRAQASGLVRIPAQRAGRRRVPHPRRIGARGRIVRAQRAARGQSRGLGAGRSPGRALPRAPPVPRLGARGSPGAAARADPMKAALLIVLAACAWAAPRGAAAGAANGSLLALSLIEGPSEPSLVMAQRTIERTWGE